MGKDNLDDLYKPTRNMFIGMRVLPTVHQRELSNVQGNPHYYPEVSCQLLYTNQYFLNTTLVLSHIHAQTNTHTHTSLKVLHFRL